MEILELKDKRNSLLEVVRVMVSTTKEEKRKMTDVEETEVNTMLDKVKTLDEEIRVAEEALNDNEKYTNVTEVTKKEENTMNKRFSISQAVKESLEGKFSDQSMAVIKEGQELLRNTNTPQAGQFAVPWKSVTEEEERAAGLSAGSDGGGGYSVYDQPWDLLRPLTDALVLVQAGAKMHTNLSGGDLSLLSVTAPTVSWTTETGSVSNSGVTFTESTFSPKRLSAVIPISRQLINQSSYAVDEIIKDELVRQIAIKVEGAALSESDVSNACSSLMAANKGSQSGSLATFTNIVGMETTVAGNNNLIGQVAYITNSTGRGKMKSSQKVTTASGSSEMLIENNELNGYPVYSTNAIKSTYGAGNDEYGVLFGDISDVNIFNFGAVDVIVDQLTLAASGQIRLVVSAYFDLGTLRSTALTAASFTA